MLTTKLHTEVQVSVEGAPDVDHGRIYKNAKGITVCELPRYATVTLEDLQQIITAMKEFQDHA